MPVPENLPASENVDASANSQPAGLKPHFYKCLINQLAQKLRKKPPVYQTHNEGLAHLPKFRSTVWFDGTSYTSPNTFQQRKMAEMDVSKIAYIAVMHKSKNEALNHIQEDKIFCKSILAEYADKISIAKPKYETTQLATLVPKFCSSLFFNGVTFQGDGGKSKKEAEQLVARGVILSYLDSESGNDMAEIINCKFRRYVEMNKVQEIPNGTNVVGLQTGVDHGIALTEVKVESGTTTMTKSSTAQGTTVLPTFTYSGVTQPCIPEVRIEAITPAIPVVTQILIPQVSEKAISPAVTVVTQTPIPEVPVDAITPAVPVVTQPDFLELSLDSSSPAVPIVTQPPVPIVEEDSEWSPELALTLEYIPLVAPTSERKRNWKNKTQSQKKMRVDAKMSGQPFSLQ